MVGIMVDMRPSRVVLPLLSPGQSRALHERMRALGLQQQHVAPKIGMSESFLSRCVNGRRHFTEDAFDRLCSLLGVKPGDVWRDDIKQ